LFSFALLVFATTGCRYLYEKDAGLPAYLYVPGITLSTDPIGEGTNSHNVQDIWVFIDDEVQGVYPLPARIPILRGGNVSLRLNGGILLNGISSTRAAYPFYASFDTVLNLTAGETDTVTPRLRYNADIDFLWLENFEGQGLTIRRNVQSDTTLIRETDPAKVFEGSNVMAAYLDTARDYFMAESTNAFSLARDGSSCFLELNYKNNVPLLVGLIVISPSGGTFEQPIVQLNTTDSWKKQYINFTPYLEGNSGFTYRIILAAGYNRTDGQTGEVLIDNIKLIR
jgi:hypothetical protein